MPQSGTAQPAQQNIFENSDSNWWEGGQQVDPGEEFRIRQNLSQKPIDKLTRRQGGRRSRTRTDRKRGRYIQARPAHGKTSDIAFDATIRAAAPHQKDRDKGKMAFSIRKQDLQEKVRVKKQANLVMFVVDASWSMAVAERMMATKGAIMSLLTDAYQRRDRVGLIVFQKNQSRLVLPPTNSVELAQKALADIPVGGKTPLSAGLAMTYEVIQKDLITHPDVIPMMILLTDGAGNVAIGSLPPLEEAHRIADRIKEAGIKSVVINMEHASFDQGLTQNLANRLNGPCYALDELRADLLYETVRGEMNSF